MHQVRCRRSIRNMIRFSDEDGGDVVSCGSINIRASAAIARSHINLRRSTSKRWRRRSSSTSRRRSGRSVGEPPRESGHQQRGQRCPAQLTKSFAKLTARSMQTALQKTLPQRCGQSPNLSALIRTLAPNLQCWTRTSARLRSQLNLFGLVRQKCSGDTWPEVTVTPRTKRAPSAERRRRWSTLGYAGESGAKVGVSTAGERTTVRRLRSTAFGLGLSETHSERKGMLRSQPCSTRHQSQRTSQG